MDQNGLNPGEIIEFEVPENSEGERLDRWLSEELSEEASRSDIQKWIQSGSFVALEGKLRSSRKVKRGEIYRLEVPEPPEPDLTPMDLHLKVLYEDDHLAVIVKPPGISVHPGPGDAEKTLVNGLLYLWKDLPVIGDPVRPGIVHRLDKPTEGLLVVAKNAHAHRNLSQAFQERNVEKIYNAWLLASPGDMEGTIDLPIGRNTRERMKMRIDHEGRNAVTHYRVEKSVNSLKGRKFSFVSLKIETGRTHQIRVHMAHSGAPVVGDSLYSRSGKTFGKFGLLLFAKSLSFPHPKIADRLMHFDLELPERFLDFESKCQYY